MATSGSITTNTVKKSYFYVNWSQASQSIPNNTTTINWTAGIYTGTSSSHDMFYSNAIKINNVYINGSQVYSGGTWSNIKTGGNHDLTSGTAVITHNSDGTKSFSISISAWTYSSSNYSGSGTGTLNTIPRYFSQTPTLTYKSKTETSITLTWSTSETCDNITWNRTASSVTGVPGTSGTVTFSSLAANTAYTCYGTFRRQDSQLTTSSSTSYSQTTYNYPYVTSLGAAALTIGNNQTVNLYNPLSRSCTVYMKKDNTGGTQFASASTSTTKATLSPTASTMYTSIPNSSSGNCVYYVVCSSPSHTSGTYAGTYVCSQSACTPTTNGAPTYKDTNSTTTGITSNDQYIIQSKSNCKVIIPSAASAKNRASISSYTVTLGSQTKTVTAIGSSNPIDFGPIDSSSNLSLSYYATDSRGFKSASTSAVTVNMVPWQEPSVTISQLERNGGYSSTVYLTVNASYSHITIGSTDKNTLVTHSYSYTNGTDTGTGTWTSGTRATISNINTDNDYTFTITYADTLSGTKTITRTLAKGVAILMIDPTVNGVGINCFPSAAGLYISGNRVVTITKGTGSPSGGSDGDIFIKYTA